MKRLLALLLALPLSATAATCSISSPGLNFGSISFLTTAGVQTQAPIDVACDTTGIPAVIGFSDAGGALQATGTSYMALQGVGSALYYRLYQDPARTIPWGQNNGTGATRLMPAHLTVYASIPCADNTCYDTARPLRAGIYEGKNVTLSVAF